MAAPKRLGRGLGSIIAGGTSAIAKNKGKATGTQKPASAPPSIPKATPKSSLVKKHTSLPSEGFFEIETDLIDVSPFQARKMSMRINLMSSVKAYDPRGYFNLLPFARMAAALNW